MKKVNVNKDFEQSVENVAKGLTIYRNCLINILFQKYRAEAIVILAESNGMSMSFEDQAGEQLLWIGMPHVNWNSFTSMYEGRLPYKWGRTQVEFHGLGGWIGDDV